MPQEEPNFKYVVEFEDGLSSRLGVHGLDSRRKEVYGTKVVMGISIEVGDEVKPKYSRGDQAVLSAKTYGRVRATVALNEPFRVPLSELHPDWEKRITEAMQRDKVNVIRVESSDQVEAAVEHHRQGYERQFEELAEQLVDSFDVFMLNHPIYDTPDHSPRKETHRLMVFSPDGLQGTTGVRFQS